MVQRPASETRTLDQIRMHYQVECELADQLRHANKAERRQLYTTVYDDLCRRVPDHPALSDTQNLETRIRNVAVQVRLIRQFWQPGGTFLEVGPGDCRVALEMARDAKMVYAVDVATARPKLDGQTDNFAFLVSDGSSIALPSQSVDLAYSNQVMEHIHPEDALDQLRNIYDVLVPGGHYICTTPHRLTGPHDISKYFDVEARGFHLKEYTVGELASAFTTVGFSRVRVIPRARGKIRAVPIYPSVAIERALQLLPPSRRRAVGRWPGISSFLGIRLIATK